MKPSGHWVKMWTCLLESEKHQALKPWIFKSWTNFTLIAKVHDDIIPSDAQIAWHLRVSTPEARRQREALMAEGLIDTTDHGLMMHDWDDWQATSTERVRKHRMEQKRNTNGTPDETRMEHSMKRTEVEKEEEVEEEVEPPIAPQGGQDGFALVHQTAARKGRTTQQQRAWFDQFWAAYWRKIGKGAAWAKFKLKVRDEGTFTRVMNALCEQTPEMTRKEPQFIPHPATWLNQDRFEDETTAPAVMSFGNPDLPPPTERVEYDPDCPKCHGTGTSRILPDGGKVTCLDCAKIVSAA